MTINNYKCVEIESIMKSCLICEGNYQETHFNQRYCSNECKWKAKRISQENYKKSEKGILAKKRWIQSDKRKENESNYRKKESYKEKNRSRIKKYHQTIKGKIMKSNVYGRRKSILDNAGKFTKEEWENKLKEYNYSCANCQTKENITIDHIIPLSKGGKNTIDNLQPLCGLCNSRKNNKIIDRYEKG